MLSSARLAALLQVAHSGTIAAAAKNLRLTPSAVSHHISTLEKELDTKLVERGNRGVQLTAAGARLAEYSESIMGLMDRAETETRELGSGAAGQLNLGFFASAGLHLVPNALSRFIRERPSVSLNLIQGQPYELIPRLLNRELDVAVVFSYSSSPKSAQLRRESSAIRYEDLVEESHFLAVPPSYRPVHRGPVQISDLVDQPWIATQGMENEASMVDRLCAAAGYSPRVRCRTDYYEVALGMVSADVGFALIPGMSLIPWSVAQMRGIRLSRLATTHPTGRTVRIATRAGNPNPLVDAITAQLQFSAAALGQEIDRLETVI